MKREGWVMISYRFDAVEMGAFFFSSFSGFSRVLRLVSQCRSRTTRKIGRKLTGCNTDSDFMYAAL